MAAVTALASPAAAQTAEDPATSTTTSSTSTSTTTTTTTAPSTSTTSTTSTTTTTSTTVAAAQAHPADLVAPVDLGPPPPESRRDSDGDKVRDDVERWIASAGRASAGGIAGVGGAEPALPVVVEVDDMATAGLALAVADEPPPEDLFGELDMFTATLTADRIARLAGLPEVRSVSGVDLLAPANTSAGASIGATQVAAELGVDGDRDGNPGAYTTADVVVGVVDTGVDSGHTALDGGKVLARVDFTHADGCEAYGPYADGLDPHGHGTHVAATVAGTGGPSGEHRGLASGAAIVDIRVLCPAGSTPSTMVLAGIDWAIANRATYGIDVLNLSLGGGYCSDGDDPVSAAVDEAWAHGIAVIVAAGNRGPAACSIGAPGAARHALTVGAVRDLGPSGGFVAERYSSRGPVDHGQMKPDVAAPGSAITSAASGTYAGTRTMSGTSMATAVVSGAAALMLDANPGLAPDDLYAALRETAQDWGRGADDDSFSGRGWDAHHGTGVVDVEAAVRRVAGAGADGHALAPHATVEGVVRSGETLRIPVTVTDAKPLGVSLLHVDVTGDRAGSPDLDLYWYRPGAGTPSSSGTTNYRVESMSVSPGAAGTHTLEIRSYVGTGEFVVDLSGGIAVPSAPPGAPRDVRVHQGQGRLTVSWNPPSGGQPPVLYTVLADGIGPIATVPASTRTVTVDHLSPDRTYKVRVVAQNLAGAGPRTGVVAARPALYRPFDSSTRLVAQLYRDFLLREPDPGGLAYWASVLDSGVSGVDVAEAFYRSAEFEGRIAVLARLYQAVFRRIPDHGGLDHWMHRRVAGADLTWIANHFAASPEFAASYGHLDDVAFVDLVYRNVLGRPPDAVGHLFWWWQLASGTLDRGSVVLGFSESAEFRARTAARTDVVLVHYAMLRRMPTASELATWEARLRNGHSRAGLIDAVMHSPAYAARAS